MESKAAVIDKATQVSASAYRARGKSLADVWRLVIAATDEDDLDLLELLADNINAVDARPLRKDGLGNEYRDYHGFLEWMQGLADGSHTMPEEMPRVLLASWAVWNMPDVSPIVMLRCAGCKLALPNAAPGNHNEQYPYWRACPSCGEATFEERDLSREGGHFFRPAQ